MKVNSNLFQKEMPDCTQEHLRQKNEYKQGHICGIHRSRERFPWKIEFEMMKGVHLDCKDRRIIQHFYKNQYARITINNQETKAKMRNGIRQVCSISAHLFNLFIEETIKFFSGKPKGIQYHGLEVHCLRYADDIVTLACSRNYLQKMVNI